MRVLGGATVALRRIVDLVLVVLVVVVLFGLVLGKLVPLMGRQTIVVGGASMEPTIQLGAAIVIRPIEADALVVGDVVSLRAGPQHSVFTHRVITIVDRADGRWIRTQGDANAEPDPTMVPASAVIGRLELVLPFAGYLLALLSLPVGVMFVLGIAATLLAMAWLLESLELDRSRADPADGPGSPPVGVVNELVGGEPIAARPDSVGARPFASVPPVSGDWSAAASRPTVRTRLERSRQIRQRRAAWLRGGHGPID
jgi:signal peptidase I